MKVTYSVRTGKTTCFFNKIFQFSDENVFELKFNPICIHSQKADEIDGLAASQNCLFLKKVKF